MCYSKKGEKTKSKFIIDKLKSDNYERKPFIGLLCKNRLRARIQLMGMFRTLECATNYKHGYGGEICKTCSVIDDENHRINKCSRFKETNLYHSPLEYDFYGIYTDDDDNVDRTIEVIGHIWNLENGRNEMR